MAKFYAGTEFMNVTIYFLIHHLWLVVVALSIKHIRREETTFPGKVVPLEHPKR